jgi:uncharacterized membrane protein AbrB (regulator of aidB expression)
MNAILHDVYGAMTKYIVTFVASLVVFAAIEAVLMESAGIHLTDATAFLAALPGAAYTTWLRRRR